MPGAPRKSAKKAASKKAATKTTATKSPAKKAAKKAAPKKAAEKKPSAKKAPAKKAAFGRPGTAGKGEGDAAVRAWMAGVKPEQRGMVERLDALIGEVVPDVKRAVKWSMPMYGRAGRGWFAHVGAFKEYVALGFFGGADLTPQPPHGEGDGMRRARFHDASELDEKQVRAWVEQAASLPGWGKA